MMRSNLAKDGDEASNSVDASIKTLIQERARQDAELLAQHLGRAGITLTPSTGGTGATFAAGLIAYLRISEWERAGVFRHVGEILPTASETAEILRKQDLRTLQSLSLRVLKIWLTHMAWQPLGGGVADVLLQGNNADEILNRVAELLWQFRHLSPEDA